MHDRRRVQTAVTNDADSADPAYMPTDIDQAAHFRDQAQHHQTSFWCGRLLGGCGGRLAVKIIEAREVVPHFAHHSGSACARVAKGAGHTRGAHSADHLFAHRHLRSWLGQHEAAITDAATYKGLEVGHSCTELILPTGRLPLRLVFTNDLDHALLAEAKSSRAKQYVWLVRANDSVTRSLVANRVPYRLFRLVEDQNLDRRLQIGFRDGHGHVRWLALSECVLGQDTLHPAPQQPAPTTARPVPPPRAEPDPEAATPLEKRMKALEYQLTNASEAEVRSMAHQIRTLHRQALRRGTITRETEQSMEQLLARADRLAPPAATPTPVAALRRAADQQRAEREHRRLLELNGRVARHSDKMLWARKNRKTKIYREHRAALLALADEPDVPAEVTSRITQELRDFPEDPFTPSPPAQEKPRKKKRGSRRNRTNASGTGTGGPGAEPKPSTAPELQARMDERTRQILEQIRASGDRPSPSRPRPQ